MSVQCFALLTKMCTSFNSVVLSVYLQGGHNTQHPTWSSDDVIWKNQSEWNSNIYKLTMHDQSTKTASANCVWSTESFSNTYHVFPCKRKPIHLSYAINYICKNLQTELPPPPPRPTQRSNQLRSILYHSYIDFVLRKLDVQYQRFYLL